MLFVVSCIVGCAACFFGSFWFSAGCWRTWAMYSKMCDNRRPRRDKSCTFLGQFASPACERKHCSRVLKSAEYSQRPKCHPTPPAQLTPPAIVKHLRVTTAPPCGVIRGFQRNQPTVPPEHPFHRRLRYKHCANTVQKRGLSY